MMWDEMNGAGYYYGFWSQFYGGLDADEKLILFCVIL